MIKIVVTYSDFGAAANIGGNVEFTSDIIEIPTQNIPKKLKNILADPDIKKWISLSFSLLNEDDI